MLHMLPVAGFIILILCIFRSHRRIYAHLKNLETLASVPLEISPDEFRARFRAQIAKSRNYFQGELFSETEFYIQYIVSPTPYAGSWIALRGVIRETEIRYDVIGKPIYQGEKVERERLINKLRELCAPEPGTAQEAE